MSTFIVDNLKGKTTANTMTVLAGHATDSTTTINLEQGLAKAWINYNGTGTVSVRDSFNMTNLTDVGTGRQTVDFVNDFSAADYSATMGTQYIGGSTNGVLVEDGGLSAARTSTTSTLKLRGEQSGGTDLDLSVASVSVFGDLA